MVTFQLRIMNCGIEIMRIHANVTSGESNYESIGWANLQDGKISPEALANLKEEEIGILQAQIEIIRQQAELKRRVSACVSAPICCTGKSIRSATGFFMQIVGKWHGWLTILCLKCKNCARLSSNV